MSWLEYRHTNIIGLIFRKCDRIRKNSPPHERAFGRLWAMRIEPPADRRMVTPYGSAKDLPSYREMAQLIQGGKLLTLVLARKQRKEILEVERQLDRLTRVVDDFYDRLGARNWIFHESLNLEKVEALLSETSDAESAEARLTRLYRDPESSRWWTMRLRSQDGLRERSHQIERARHHYDAGQFDSCVLHLIAVMDGFVNDFQPEERRGLHSRDPDDMTAWDSVVGHHLGLTHAMSTFTKTIKKRVDAEVFELYRHGIMHGTVVSFDNAVVATKAWNMLFALVDWAKATKKAAEPEDPKPSWGETWASLVRHGAYKKYEREFKSFSLRPSDPSFRTNEVILLATEFLDAWEHRRWAHVAKFMPSVLRREMTDGAAAPQAKQAFDRHHLTDWEITSVTYDQASSAAIGIVGSINGVRRELRFRVVRWTSDGKVAIPGEDDATWQLAVWAPETYLQDSA